jgi:hypothetical protein
MDVDATPMRPWQLDAARQAQITGKAVQNNSPHIELHSTANQVFRNTKKLTLE